MLFPDCASIVTVFVLFVPLQIETSNPVENRSASRLTTMFPDVVSTKYPPLRCSEPVNVYGVEETAVWDVHSSAYCV